MPGDRSYRRIACWGGLVSPFAIALTVLYAVTAALLWQGDWTKVALALALLPALIWLSLVDLERFEIPDLASAAIAVISLVYLMAIDPGELSSHLLGATLLTAFFWGFGAFYFKRNGHEGLGIGDAKLFGAGVLLLGPEKLPEFVLLSSCGGIIALGLRHMSRRQVPAGIPFGPFIAYAMFVLSFLEPVFL